MNLEPHVTLRCRNCGAEVPIWSPGTVSVTCEHCNTLNLRSDVDLESLGEVAIPAPLRSAFKIGTEGQYDGRRFIVRGFVQLDHGAGLWNEWAAETPQGWIWIAEAQGDVQVYEELHGVQGPDASHLPAIDEETNQLAPAKNDGLSAGDHVSLDGPKRWVVREIGRGRVVTARGELPVEIRAGERTLYVDLVRSGIEVATLDYTRSDPPEVMTGRCVELKALALDPSTQPSPESWAGLDAALAESVNCTVCGGTIEVLDAEKALTLGCAHCGATLQRESHLEAYRAVESDQRAISEPFLPIGSRGSLGGEQLVAMGCLRRGVRAGGQLYRWHEILLRTEDGAYRWLVENQGHITYGWPAQPSLFPRRTGGVSYRGKRARSFGSGKAMVLSVLGEFYWQVRVGEKVKALDFVLPGDGVMISLEKSPLELNASVARHVAREELMAAFPDAQLPPKEGVGPVEPNPHDAKSNWAAFLGALVLLVVLTIVGRSRAANEQVHTGSYGPTPAVADQEIVQFSEPFSVERDRANLKVAISAPTINQGYLDVLGALVNEDTGEVISFGTAAQLYSGRSGGENWREGNGRGSTLIGSVPSGRYRLRLAARGYDKGVNTAYEVQVHSDVPRWLWFLLALAALFAYPLIVGLRMANFETQRWSNSDF